MDLRMVSAPLMSFEMRSWLDPPEIRVKAIVVPGILVPQEQAEARHALLSLEMKSPPADWVAPVRDGRYAILSPLAAFSLPFTHGEAPHPLITRFPVYWAFTAGSTHWAPPPLGRAYRNRLG